MMLHFGRLLPLCSIWFLNPHIHSICGSACLSCFTYFSSHSLHQVAYAGACYRTRYLNNKNDFRVHAPGYEISGVVEALGGGIDKNRCHINLGDHVVVYPFEKEGNSTLADTG